MHPHTPVPLTINVIAGRDEILRELAKADRVVFDDKIVGPKYKERGQSPPWWLPTHLPTFPEAAFFQVRAAQILMVQDVREW